MLNEQQLGDYIDRHFTSKLFRLEALDRYEVGSNGDDLARYLAGEPGPSMARKGPWMDQIRKEVARGLHTYRVHIVRGPLTDYLRFEFEWGYVYNAAAGEHIRVLDLSERPGSSAPVDEDFWLIDEDHGALMRYGPDGTFIGAEIMGDQDIPRYRAVRDAIWEAAIPFSEYWDTHPQYWREHRHAA